MKIQSIETKNYIFDVGKEMSYGIIKDIKWVDDRNNNCFKVIFDKAEIFVFDINLAVFVEDGFEF